MKKILEDIDIWEIIKTILMGLVMVLFTIHAIEYQEKKDETIQEITKEYILNEEYAKDIVDEILKNDNIIEINEIKAIDRRTGELYLGVKKTKILLVGKTTVPKTYIEWNLIGQYDYELLNLINEIEKKLIERGVKQ